MATFAEIRSAVKTTVEDNIDGLKVYPRVPGNATSRALVVRPAIPTDFNVVMRRGTDTWQIDLVVVIGLGDMDVAQQHLDGYVDGGGANSIRKVIFDNRTLGLANTDAHVSGLIAYGDTVNASYDNISATLRLVVHTVPS
jgi:hypothetical protein